jgi:hypothetical protein
MVDGKLPLTGKVGGAVTVEQAKELAQICALNALAPVQTVAEVDDIVRVIRVVGYVNGIPGFITQPAVVNGASELSSAHLGRCWKACPLCGRNCQSSRSMHRLK